LEGAIAVVLGDREKVSLPGRASCPSWGIMKTPREVREGKGGLRGVDRTIVMALQKPRRENYDCEAEGAGVMVRPGRQAFMKKGLFKRSANEV